MKYKEIQKLSNTEREKKLKELKMELVKESSAKQGGNKSAKIRKIVARIHTFNNAEKKSAEVENKK